MCKQNMSLMIATECSVFCIIFYTDFYNYTSSNSFAVESLYNIDKLAIVSKIIYRTTSLKNHLCKKTITI